MFLKSWGRLIGYASCRALHAIGTILIGVGVVLIVVNIPLRYWMALLGVLLIAAGIVLRMLS